MINGFTLAANRSRSQRPWPCHGINRRGETIRGTVTTTGFPPNYVRGPPEQNLLLLKGKWQRCCANNERERLLLLNWWNGCPIVNWRHQYRGNSSFNWFQALSAISV